MPPSTAALTIGSAAVSSRTHGRSLSFPKLIMPRHTLDTLRPVRPRFVYLIATSSPSRTRRPYRRGAAPERRRAVHERFGWFEIHGGSGEPGAVGPPCRVVERAVCTRQTRVVAPQEIDDYLLTLDEPKRSTLEGLRKTIMEIVPGAEESISYRVPAFKVQGKAVAGFAAFKNHLSYVPHSGSVLASLQDETAPYETS